MPRMILSHPRSGSHLLGSAYPTYVSELFSTHFIINTPYYHQNKEMIKGMVKVDTDHPFAMGYIQWLRETFAFGKTNQNFTFKVHYCDIKNWPDARELINEWLDRNPVYEDDWFICIEREDKAAAIISLLVAEQRGYTKYSEVEVQPFEASLSDMTNAYQRVVLDNRLGQIEYHARIDTVLTYEGLLKDLQEHHFGTAEEYRTFMDNNRYQPQHSLEAAETLITNLLEVRRFLKEMGC